MSSPVVTWNTTTINGVPCLVIDMAQLVVPLDFDPSSNMFLAVGVPSGGYANLPILLQGDVGATPTFDSTVILDVLDYTDPTADSMTLAPLGGNAYQASLTFHRGAPGTPGTTTLDPSAYGTPVSGKTLIVNPTNNGFLYQAQMVGDSYWPATILSAPSGNITYTLCSVAIPALSFAWRPQVSGQTVVTGTGANVDTTLVARLQNETAGNIVAQGFSPSGTNATGIATVLSDGPPAGSISAFNTVAAGVAAVVYLRVERQSGTNTFTTSNTTTTFKVFTQPIPGTGVTG
jgi:hypothetical protein